MAGHLTAAERDRIALLLQQGADQQEIARTLRRHPSTIGRELTRNRTDHEYLATQAQHALRVHAPRDARRSRRQWRVLHTAAGGALHGRGHRPATG
ncbi:MAG: helix-turn-helix domain-containing protein [Planctomycetes bacterium]|nr:helix-turn-helix domain-containing protein [Planctomycetota bacterium]